MRSNQWFLVSLLICLFCIDVFASDAENNSKDETQIYHVDEGIDVVSTLKFTYGNHRLVIKAVYPQLQTNIDSEGVDNFNELILNMVQEEREKFIEQVSHSQDVQKKLPKSEIRNNLYIDYDTSVIRPGTSHIISVRFSIQGYMSGMAHPFHYHRVLNYDLENFQKIELQDLFRPDVNYLGFLSDYTRKVLLRRLKNNSMLLGGTTPTEENFKDWNIKSNGILITFDEYQVAPYVNGAQTVLIPYYALKPVASPDSPIFPCVKYRNRCSKAKLLTGGFIDEAVFSNHRHRILNPSLRTV